MKEHNNRAKAKKLAEFITGDKLRQYLADKVKHYVGESLSVFDGACGSGQLEQYLNASALIAVEIQKESCEMIAENYPCAEVYHQSFFEFDKSLSVDCVVMNPPFSLKFKDLSETEQANIQARFEWKKSGVVDDIFVLKAHEYSKRFSFFILSCGLATRASEKKFRELVGNQIVECNRISNAFDDTSIDVMFLVLDKQKTNNQYRSEHLDFESNEYYEKDFILNDERWEMATKPNLKEVVDLDIHALNQELLENDLKKLDCTLSYHRSMVFMTGIDFIGFCDKALDIVNKHKVEYELA